MKYIRTYRDLNPVAPNYRRLLFALLVIAAIVILLGLAGRSDILALSTTM